MQQPNGLDISNSIITRVLISCLFVVCCCCPPTPPATPTPPAQLRHTQTCVSADTTPEQSLVCPTAHSPQPAKTPHPTPHTSFAASAAPLPRRPLPSRRQQMYSSHADPYAIHVRTPRPIPSSYSLSRRNNRPASRSQRHAPLPRPERGHELSRHSAGVLRFANARTRICSERGGRPRPTE